MSTILTNCAILSDGKTITGKAVLLKGEKIEAVLSASDIPADAEIIDLNGNYLSPGLLDLQIYGSGGKLFGGIPTEDALEQMENDLLAQGTVGFFATVATNTPEIVKTAIAAAKAYRNKAKGNFLGLHLEGPYLNPKKRGAHPAELIKKATVDELKEWIELADGEIKMITIAPELQDSDIVDYLNEMEIVISAGHSDATYDEAISFFPEKIHAATHLYNAMPAIHHREPGLVPAIFKTRPYTSVVADGIHVSFPMIELAKRELGDRFFLITDAVTTANSGVYQHVFAGDRFTMPDGTLSGSCLTMLRAVQNCVQNANINLAEAVNMAALYPARLAKMDTRKGLIAKGFDADLLVFDKNFEVQKVIFKGSLN